jgi:hypothetical protein
MTYVNIDFILPSLTGGRSHGGQVMCGGRGSAFSGSAVMACQNLLRATVLVQAVGLLALPMIAAIACCNSFGFAANGPFASALCRKG